MPNDKNLALDQAQKLTGLVFRCFKWGKDRGTCLVTKSKDEAFARVPDYNEYRPVNLLAELISETGNEGYKVISDLRNGATLTGRGGLNYVMGCHLPEEVIPLRLQSAQTAEWLHEESRAIFLVGFTPSFRVVGWERGRKEEIHEEHDETEVEDVCVDYVLRLASLPGELTYALSDEAIEAQIDTWKGVAFNECQR